jgi:hypothetical protein
VLLFGHGLDRRPFGQHQLFGVKWVHGAKPSALGWHFKPYSLGWLEGKLATANWLRTRIEKKSQKNGYSTEYPLLDWSAISLSMPWKELKISYI